MTGEAKEALELNELKARYEKAMDHVCALAEGTARWKMTIPVDLERDSDIILTRALNDVPALVAEVERLTQERDEARSALESVRDFAVAVERQNHDALKIARKTLNDDYSGNVYQYYDALTAIERALDQTETQP